MKEHKFSDSDAYTWMKQFLQRFSDHGTPNLDDLLLPDDHPSVVAYLASALTKPCPWEDRAGGSSDEGCKWPKDHIDHARSHPERRCQSVATFQTPPPWPKSPVGHVPCHGPRSMVHGSWMGSSFVWPIRRKLVVVVRRIGAALPSTNKS